MKLFAALLLLAQAVFTYPPGQSAVQTRPEKPPGNAPVCNYSGKPNGLGGFSVYVGYGYPLTLPASVGVVDYSAPNRMATEWKVTGYSNWGDPTVTFGAGDIGVLGPQVWGRNCANAVGDFVVPNVSVQNSGWATGEPRVSLTDKQVEFNANPATVTFDTMFIQATSVTSVVIKDTSDNTTVYTGAYQTGMTNNTYFTCSKYAQAYIRTLEFAITNATGTMTLTAPLYLQDNMGVCP